MLAALAFLLAACGPQIGALEKGEQGRVVRAYNGDTLVLDTGLRVFLAEIDAPRGRDDYASQAQGELEALALHRDVLLAYGGTKRWAPQPRGEQAQAPPETAIAHVFVRSEGGRWFWLQHALVSRGAAFVRARKDNDARADDLLALEDQARASARGLWGRRAWRMLSPRAEADVSDARTTLKLEGGTASTPFSLVAFGDALANWDGPDFVSLTGTRIRVRGALGMFEDKPQLCLDDARQLEILTERTEDEGAND